jgi:hypothetical protein
MPAGKSPSWAWAIPPVMQAIVSLSPPSETARRMALS